MSDNVNKVLIIDASHSARRDAARALRQAGYEVVEAATGKQAVQQLQRIKPSLILLELCLPDVDGMRILELCKAYPTAAAIPIVILTAPAGPRDVEHAFTLGAADLLCKPVDPPQLVSRIRGILSAVASEGDEPWAGANRREFVRGSLINVRLDPVPVGEATDISEGGLAWRTESLPRLNELIHLDSPQLLRVLGLRSANANLRVRVVSISVIRPGTPRRGKLVRVGSAFIGLRGNDADHIRRYVFERQTRAVLGHRVRDRSSATPRAR